jgi:hypothetical protein
MLHTRGYRASIDEQRGPATDDGESRIGLKYADLTVEPARLGKVVSIEPSDETAPAA